MLSITDAQIIGYLIPAIGFLVALLLSILGWIGVKVIERLDSMGQTLANIERDLRKDFSALDRRVQVLELSSSNRPYFNPTNPPGHINKAKSSRRVGS